MKAGVREHGPPPGGKDDSKKHALGTWTCGCPTCDNKVRKIIQDAAIAKWVKKGDNRLRASAACSRCNANLKSLSRGVSDLPDDV